MQIRVGGVPEHFNLPWHLGLETGRFAQAGLDVSFHEFPTGTGSMCKALRKDEIDLAVALTEGLLMDIAAHDQIRLLAPYVLSPLRWGIHVAAESDYQTESELKNATVAISRQGSGSHLMALLWARSSRACWIKAPMCFYGKSSRLCPESGRGTCASSGNFPRPGPAL